MQKYAIECLITFAGKEVDDLTSKDFFMPYSTLGVTVFLKHWEPKSDRIGWLRFWVVTNSKDVQSAIEYALHLSSRVWSDVAKKDCCEVLKVFNETEGRWENLPENDDES